MRRCRRSLGFEEGLARMRRRVKACGRKPRANASAERLGLRWQALARHRFRWLEGMLRPENILHHTRAVLLSQAGSRAVAGQHDSPRESGVVDAGLRLASVPPQSKTLSRLRGRSWQLQRKAPAPHASGAAFAGWIEGCGRTARWPPRKRCRRCRLAPCISVTAVQDAGALAGGWGFLACALDH